jgi:hypothetical protein
MKIPKKNLQHITKSAPEFDRLFTPHKTGYLGADAALSIPLPDGRVLWLFGDTLIGRQEQGKRIFEAMPRNTVAIQYPGAVCPENIEWIFTGRQGIPSDFLSLPKDEQNRWFWPGTGVCIDAELFLFGYRVTFAKSGCEALSFRVLDSWMMRVRDTSGHPREWQIEAQPFPSSLHKGLFCSACLFEEPFLYLLGIYFKSGLKSFQDTSSVLARVHVEDLRKNESLFHLEYWSEGRESPDWTGDPDPPAVLYKPGVTECSLFYDAPRGRYLATTYRPSKPDFYITTAPSLTGHWSPPALISREQDSRPVQSHLYYAMRMHPHLASTRDEMILTYIVNTRSFADLLTSCDKYYPRFLRIDLNGL